MAYTVAVVWGGAQGGPSQLGAERVAQALRASGHEARLVRKGKALARELVSLGADVAFPCLAQAPATPADLASLLELIRLPFVGTGARMARLAADKSNLPPALRLAARQGPTAASSPMGVCLSSEAVAKLGALDLSELVLDRCGGAFPLCVKPAHGTRGADVTRVATLQELADAAAAAARKDDQVVVEQWVEGPLVSVAVVGDEDNLGVLPAALIQPATPADGRAEAAAEGPLCPDTPFTQAVAPLPCHLLSPDPVAAQDARSQIERDALDAFLACGARDLARVDLVWDGAASRVLEVDLAPSLTEGSVLSCCLALTGVPFEDLVNELVEGAVERGC